METKTLCSVSSGGYVKIFFFKWEGESEMAVEEEALGDAYIHSTWKQPQ